MAESTTTLESKEGRNVLTECLPESAHMPFLTNCEGYALLIYCHSVPELQRSRGRISGYRFSPWKLRYAFPQIPATGSIPTGLPAAVEECSPCLSMHQGKLLLSFIARISEEGITIGDQKIPSGYHMFRLTGQTIESLEHLEIVHQSAIAGFEFDGTVVFSDGGSTFAVIRGKDRIEYGTSFSAIHRITVCADQHHHLLISGATKDGSEITVMFDCGNEEMVGELRMNDESVYKPTMLTKCSRWIVAPVVFQSRTKLRAMKAQSSFELCPCAVKISRS